MRFRSSASCSARSISGYLLWESTEGSAVGWLCPVSVLSSLSSMSAMSFEQCFYDIIVVNLCHSVGDDNIFSFAVTEPPRGAFLVKGVDEGACCHLGISEPYEIEHFHDFGVCDLWGFEDKGTVGLLVADNLAGGRNGGVPVVLEGMVNAGDDGAVFPGFDDIEALVDDDSVQYGHGKAVGDIDVLDKPE